METKSGFQISKVDDGDHDKVDDGDVVAKPWSLLNQINEVPEQNRYMSCGSAFNHKLLAVITYF